MSALRVLVADDHPLFRSGLRALLSGQPDMEVCGEAASYPELLSIAATLRPSVILLDLRMPGGSALDAISRLRRDQPSARILVLSSYPEDAMLVPMLQAGAAGYMHKEAAADQVLAAIRRVASGGTWVSDSGAQALARALRPGAPLTDHSGLSPRESQVLRLLGSGVPPSDIAQRLHVNVKTVSTYRSRLMEKMGFSTTADIIRYALEHDLTE